MKKMIMKVKEVNKDFVWQEEYTIPDDSDPTEYATRIINGFNSNLQLNEGARELVEVIEVGVKMTIYLMSGKNKI